MQLNLLTKDNYRSNKSMVKDLVPLFTEYFIEVHSDDFIGNDTTIADMVVTMLKDNRSIYTLYEGEEAIGLLVVFINNQYNNIAPVVYNDYMYITPKYRSGKAIMMMYNMLGNICEDYKMDGVGCTYTTSSNSNNNKTLGGKVIAEVTLFPLTQVKRINNKFNKRINR